MANAKLVLAVAGAGKTYYIAENLNQYERNIVITFTNRNVLNLEREIGGQYDGIPENTIVMTFSSFVYRWLIKPIEPHLVVGDIRGIDSNGLDLYTPLEKPGIKSYNPRYYKKDHHRHYLSTGNNLYIKRMVGLFKEQKQNIKKLAYERLNKFCGAIFIDELQDFVGFDYDILQQLLKLKKPYVLGVGDFYQHSVSKTNFGATRPFKKNKRDITKQSYICGFGKKVEIDEKELLYSRRVPKLTCNFIRKKLGINIESISEKPGGIELLSNMDDIKEVIRSKQVVKIVYRNVKAYDLTPITNWSYCKGDTYKDTLVVLTSKFKNIMSNDFTTEGISQQEINKLYVALSRATNKTFLAKPWDFKEAIKW